jgi:hypothetical protein
MKRLRYSPSGVMLPTSVDGRSRPARRFRFLVESYSTELGGGLSEAEKAMIRQIVALQIFIEEQQARVVAGLDVDSDELIRSNSEHRRLLGALGKKAATVKPDAATALDQYLKDKYGAHTESEIEDEPEETP